jgi:hypothetical protein
MGVVGKGREMAGEMRRGIVGVVCLATFCSLAWGRYGGGTGTASDPYLIYTAEHLRQVGVYRSDWRWDAHYKLMTDIDLAELKTPLEPMGTSHIRFMGDFDGNGKTISNLRITASSGNNIGLFGYAEGEFRDLGLINVEIVAPDSKYVGALAGRLVGGTVERCYVRNGTLTGDYGVGSLVGDTGASFHQCSASSCSVTGQEWVGGLLGSHWGAVVSQCFAEANVHGGVSAGGLIGSSSRAVKDCYVIGEVVGSLQVGGLIGFAAQECLVWNCYAAARARWTWGPGGPGGGVCGTDVYSCNSFWDSQVSGPTSNSCGVGKTKDELCRAATFRGWGRGAAWTIDEGKDYPRLVWENRPGTPLDTPAFPASLGEGTAQQPYVIRTAAELAAIGEFPDEWDKRYRLECDIDLSGRQESVSIIGCYSAPFTGMFDGNGHSISNFEYSDIRPYVGLFGATRGAVVRRLTLINPRLDQGIYSWSGRVGPLIGWQVEGTVEACGVDGGLVAASNILGGLVGESYSGTITRCYSTCKIDSYNGPQNLGGLLGLGERCNINNCYTRGEIVTGKNVGGLIGKMYYGSVSHCYSATVLDGGTYVCGLIGYPIDTLGVACFWDVQTSKQITGAVGTGASTADLQKASTYINAGWDFVGEHKNGTADIWSIDEGRDYPRFSEGSVVPPERVWADDFEDGEAGPLWQAYEPAANVASLEETNHRLELRVPQSPVDRTLAACVSSGWALDCSQDFRLKVDFHFAKMAAGEGWVSIDLAPSLDTPVTRRIELAAGCLDNESRYTAERADGLGFANWWVDRGCDNGTLYVSYDAAEDALYLSYTGFGPVNAWRTVTGLLKGRWSGGPVYVVLAGGSDGMEIKEGEAWLDNFAVDTGAILE